MVQVEFGSHDGTRNDEHNGAGFVEIGKVFAVQEAFCSLEQGPVREHGIHSSVDQHSRHCRIPEE